MTVIFVTLNLFQGRRIEVEVQRSCDSDTPLRYGDRVTAIACGSGVPFVKQVRNDIMFTFKAYPV